MALRYLGEYITQVRRDTTTRDSSFSNGISDDQIVEYFRDGQDRLQSKLFSRYPNIFEVETTFSPVANQESYTPPTDDYAINSIVSLEYSPTGVDRDYYFLTRNIINARTNIPVNYPTQYILSGSRILIQPKINTSAGLFRLVYTKQIPSLDIRRGVVASVVSSSGYYNGIILDPSGTPTPDATALSTCEYVSIVDKHGTIKYSGLSRDNWDPTILSLKFDPGTAPTSAGTISTGDYVVIGASATTHSTLPSPMGGRYLMAFASWRILMADNSISSPSKEKELTAYENDIIETFGTNDRDIPYMPYTEDFL